METISSKIHLAMEWKNVKKNELPLCNIKAFDDTDDEDDVNWMESERVIVVVNQITHNNNKYITFGRMDEHEEWMKGEDDERLDKTEEVTHWMPFPELPIE